MPQIDDIARFAFIVGAPRCGTTTLANFLKSHPDVCFPIMKEPHYFAQNDLTGLSFRELVETVETQYLARFFPHCTGGAHTAADCSVSSLYASEQLEPVLRLWPDSRFVIALRDPMEMLPSLHRRLLFLGDETLTRFEDAWAAVPDRAAGRRIPRKCIEPRWLRYDEAGRYSTYLERLFATVGRERCLVLLFDDLAADPLGQYRRLVHFLGLRRLEETIELTPRRRSHDVRSIWLQRLLKRPPKAVRKYLAGPYQRERERKLDGESSDGAALHAIFGLRKRLLHWNRIPARRQSISPKVQQQIRDQLSGEIERLEELIGRDLGHWLQLRPETEGATRRGSSARLEPSLTAAE